MTSVVLKDVALTRGVTPILRSVNLSLRDGEFCVFVGPSGCGKSTLLRLIAGLDSDASGQIHIGSREVTALPPAQREVAMVFQGYALYPHMTVRENMAFALQRAKLPKDEIGRRLAEASRILQLGNYLDRKPGALSGGQRQRVAIGRAIVKRPKVFLFDEPLSNLDASLRVETRMEIAKLHKDMGSASVIYVTHDQVEAMTLADRIVLLRPLAGAAPDQGSVVQVGTPMELYHRPADLFAARFMGSPGMNLLQATVAGGDAQQLQFQLQGQALQARVDRSGLAEGAALHIGIRPEHVRLGGPLRGQVRHVEHLGEHSVVFLDGEGWAGNQPLLLKTAEQAPAVGDTVAFSLPPEALHAFGDDGRALPRTA